MITPGQACKTLAGMGWECGYFLYWDLSGWHLPSFSEFAKPGRRGMVWKRLPLRELLRRCALDYRFLKIATLNSVSPYRVRCYEASRGINPKAFRPQDREMVDPKIR